MQTMMVEATRGNVLVVDPHVLRRACLLRFLAEWAETHNVFLLPQAPENLRDSDSTDIHCALSLFNLANLPVAEAVAAAWWQDAMRILSPAPAVILSDSEKAEDVIAAARAGARGFIPTTMEPAIALRALSFIMAGGSFFPPGALLQQDEQLFRRAIQLPRRIRPNNAPPEQQGLTTRQSTVFQCLQDGQSNKAIARVLSLRESTVKVHVGQIMRKLGVSNRTQIALLTLPEPAFLAAGPGPVTIAA